MTDPDISARVGRWLERQRLPVETPRVLLAGDASTRRYVRVTPESTTSVVLLVHPDRLHPESDPFLNVGRLFRELDVAVPTVHGHDVDLGIVVLDDLGDVTLQSYLFTASPADRRARYREAVEIIARIQTGGATLESPTYQPYGLAFDEAKLTAELSFCVEHFLVGHRSISPSPRQRAELDAELGRLARELAAEPRVLCHRDFHSRNLMWHRERLWVIDFQDARLGPSTYDLVSLLRDSYVSNDPVLVDDMIATFGAAVGTATGPDFKTRFDTMSVQRHLKALGTFGHQAIGGNPRYLDDIPRTLGYLRDVFGRRDRFAKLRSLLSRWLPELA